MFFLLFLFLNSKKQQLAEDIDFFKSKVSRHCYRMMYRMNFLNFERKFNHK